MSEDEDKGRAVADAIVAVAAAREKYEAALLRVRHQNPLSPQYNRDAEEREAEAAIKALASAHIALARAVRDCMEG